MGLLLFTIENSFRKQWDSYRQKYEALVYALRDHLLFCFSQLKENYSQELDQKKAHKAVLSYQDILSKTHRALYDPIKGETLLRSLLDKKKYRLALIDEFQDTDRFQAEIFGRIFDRPGQGLFLIGDPKQSIYAFRGSDIHVYQEWKAKSDSCFGLFKNYRSSPLLLAGIHAVYAAHKSFPFLDPDLEYYPTQAAPRKDGEDKAGDSNLYYSKFASSKAPDISNTPNISGEEIPLHFVLSEKNKVQGKPSVGEGRLEIQKWIAAEIRMLLLSAENSQLHYKDRVLRAEDIAILVRKKSEGLAMRTVLQEYGITVALYVDENVFSSQEAWELELVLEAIQAGGRGMKLKAALSTELWAYRARDIYALSQSESKKSDMLKRIRKYAKSWEEQGFTAMFRQWLYGEGVHCRLLEGLRGERKLSNLLHIAELIQLSKERDSQRVLCFLRQQIAAAKDAGGKASEEHTKLRMESDRNAVQIMSIHVSKGLEFPVVFYPCFSQGSPNFMNKSIAYYDSKKKIQIHTLPFLQKILKILLRVPQVEDWFASKD